MPEEYYTSSDVFAARAKRKNLSQNSTSNEVNELELFVKSKVPFILEQFEESIQSEFKRMIDGNNNPYLDTKMEVNAYAKIPMESKIQMLNAVQLEAHKWPEIVDGIHALCVKYGLEMNDKHSGYHDNPKSYKSPYRQGDNAKNMVDHFDLAFICYFKMVPPSSAV